MFRASLAAPSLNVCLELKLDYESPFVFPIINHALIIIAVFSKVMNLRLSFGEALCIHLQASHPDYLFI